MIVSQDEGSGSSAEETLSDDPSAERIFGCLDIVCLSRFGAAVDRLVTGGLGCVCYQSF